MIDNLFPNRRWLIIPTSITSSIDFNEVCEYSLDSLRLSVDGTKTFVKYDVTDVTASYTQSWIDLLTNTTESVTIEKGIYGRPSIYSSSYEEYNYPDVLALLSTPEWTSPLTGSVMN